MLKSKSGAARNQYQHVDPSLKTRDVPKFVEPTGNVYESLNIMARYANHVGLQMKNEINDKLSEFVAGPDNLEEVHENREQIEVSKQFERMPKPTQVSIEDFKDGKVFWRYPNAELEEAKS